MYEDLLKELREQSRYLICSSRYVYEKRQVLFKKSADTIEELSAKYEKALRDLVKCGAAPRWIPVTERLPEQNTRVIGFMSWKGITAIEYQNGKWYSIDHLQPLPNEAVTHWMPLPEPPKED